MLFSTFSVCKLWMLQKENMLLENIRTPENLSFSHYSLLTFIYSLLSPDPDRCIFLKIA